MIRKGDLSFVIAAALAILISFFLDDIFLRFFLAIRTPILTEIFTVISFLSQFVAVLIIGTLFLIFIRKFKAMSWFWFAMILSAGIVYVLKLSIGRPRPPVEALYITNSNSFPSGHAMSVFAAYPFMNKFFKSLGRVWWAFALLAVISRMYLGVHYLSDVIAGSLIGYSVSVLVLRASFKRK